HFRRRAPRRRQVGDADAESRPARIDQRHRIVRAALSHSIADADQLSRRVRRARSVADRGGGVTEDLLRALRIPFSYLDNVGHVAARIAKAQTLSLSANKPVALLLCRDLMWEEN